MYVCEERGESESFIIIINIGIALEMLVSTYLQTPTLGNFFPIKVI